MKEIATANCTGATTTTEERCKDPYFRSVQTGTGAFVGLWKPGKIIYSHPPGNFNDLRKLYVWDRKDLKYLVIIVIIVLIVRFRDLNNPPDQVFSESVIGGNINKYFGGQFFLDLEPPFPSQVYYVVAKLYGYTGNFDFQCNGQTFVGSPFPYTVLRWFNSWLGFITIVLSYVTLKLSGVDRISALLGACFMIFENSYATESRYIFGQSFLTFFLVLSVYLWKRSEYEVPLSPAWFRQSIALGLALGGAMCCKNSGSYLLMFVWLMNGYQLWWTHADLNVSYKRLLLEIWVRVVIFAMIPISCFIGTIMLHISMTPKSGDGDTFVSAAYQNSLISNELIPSPLNVTYGSYITLRHYETASFLHSHNYFYPGGSQQQQVTGYGYQDTNNVWMVEPESSSNVTFQMSLTDVDLDSHIRILHIATNKHLHSHKEKVPVSDNDYQYEVSAYGADGYSGDLNDFWKVEIVKDLSTDKNLHHWKAINSIVRLKHATTGCYLFSHRTNLPQWGYGQQEVTCATSGILKNSLWHVETNYNPILSESDKEPLEFVTYPQLTMAEKFIEYVDAMTKANREIKPSAVWQELSWHLPLLQKGVSFYWKNFRQVYLFGNPFIWFSSFVGLLVYIFFKVVLIIALQRGNRDVELLPNIIYLDHHAGQFAIGWLVQFIGLVIQGEGIIADYMPALYFSIMLFITLWSYLTLQVFFTDMAKIRKWLAFAMGTVVIICFLLYSPLVYGARWSKANCSRMEYTNDLKFNCKFYLDNFHQYQQFDGSSQVMDYVKYKTMPMDSKYLLPINETEYALPRNQFELTGIIRQVDVTRVQVQRLIYEVLRKRGLGLKDLSLKLDIDVEDELEGEYCENDKECHLEQSNVFEQDIEDDMSSFVHEQWSRITKPTL